MHLSLCRPAPRCGRGVLDPRDQTRERGGSYSSWSVCITVVFGGAAKATLARGASNDHMSPGAVRTASAPRERRKTPPRIDLRSGRKRRDAARSRMRVRKSGRPKIRVRAWPAIRTTGRSVSDCNSPRTVTDLDAPHHGPLPYIHDRDIVGGAVRGVQRAAVRGYPDAPRPRAHFDL